MESIPTKQYSAMLYALAKEMRDEEGCVTESDELVEQAAERLDTQTVTINVLTKQRTELLQAFNQAMSKVESAISSHPNAVRYLLDEALEIWGSATASMQKGGEA